MFKQNQNNLIQDKAIACCDNGTDTPDIRELTLDDTEAESRAYYRHDKPLCRRRRYRMKNDVSDEELTNCPLFSGEIYQFPSDDSKESIDRLVKGTTARVIKPVGKWL